MPDYDSTAALLESRGQVLQLPGLRHDHARCELLIQLPDGAGIVRVPHEAVERAFGSCPGACPPCADAEEARSQDADPSTRSTP